MTDADHGPFHHVTQSEKEMCPSCNSAAPQPRAASGRELELLRKIEALVLRLAAAEAKLASVREECAKVAEDFPDQIMTMWDRPGGPPGNGYAQIFGQKHIAAAIRSHPSPDAAGEEGGSDDLPHRG